MKKFLTCCLLSLLLVLLTCCAKAPAETEKDVSFESLNGQKLGVVTGTIFDKMSKQMFPQSEILFFNAKADMVTALKQGKVSAYLEDEPQGRYAMAKDPSLARLPGKVAEDKYGFIFPQTERGAHLRDLVNEFFEKVSSSGKLKELDEKWFSGDESRMDIPVVPKGPNGVLKVATYSGCSPFDFVFNGKMVGYEIELASLFCIEYGYSLEVSDMEFAAIIPGIVTSKYDIGMACISITEERAKSVLFSNPDYYGGAIMITLAGNYSPEEKQGFFAGLKESFNRNFVEENRWEMILSGLWVTVLISILSAIFGTAIGFGLCMQRRAKNKVLSSLAAVFIRIIQGLPIVVFLMILYYIIFAKSEISAVIVAVIGFSINFGAYVSEMMRTGIEAVDSGQIEAANAIGFNKTKTFIKITMPQAARHFIPVFKGEFISMVKMTSVVGYIAIQDLTKVSDIIRSRTYEAFFPLISTALIYFIIAYFFIFLLGKLELSLDPKRRPRSLKGVTTE